MSSRKSRRVRDASISLRLKPELKQRIDDACAGPMFGPFKVGVTAIVERGIELALQELERMRK